MKVVADKGHVGSGPLAPTGLMIRTELVEQGYLDEPSRLRGMIIATNRDNMAAYFSDACLRRVGLSLEDFAVTEVPGPAAIAAAQRGDFALHQESEPWLTRVMDTGRMTLWMADWEVIPDMQYSVLVYGPSILDEDPEAGQRFMVAFLRGARQYKEGKTERNLDILEKVTGLDRDLLARAGWQGLAEDGQLNVQSVLDFQQWASERGLIDRPLAPEEFWEPRFIEHANRVLAERRAGGGGARAAEAISEGDAEPVSPVPTGDLIRP
jgi:NitT/TauT family transport system substrate-binding protein